MAEQAVDEVEQVALRKRKAPVESAGSPKGLRIDSGGSVRTRGRIAEFLGDPRVDKLIRFLLLLLALYAFFFSIKLMGHSFKLFGKDFAKQLIESTQNPFVGLAIGIFATSLIQSSSTTTSIVVGMVAAGGLTLTNAIPIIMGANIGTTVTNTMVSLAHITRKNEFERAFAASIVHDLFNVLSVLILFPLEIKFSLIERTATRLEHLFVGVGGAKLFNPLDVILKPAIAVADRGFEVLPHPQVWMLVSSLFVLFLALGMMVKLLRSLMVTRMESLISGYLFRNDAAGLLLGLILTVSVQSSSITTSLVVPLVGAGVLTVRKMFPYVLGANVGTTITAILAALATHNEVAITAAFAHLTFNVFGIGILWWVKFIPIRIAQWLGSFIVRSRRHMVACLVIYVLMHVVPLALALL
ncbi:MAG: Na/Pi symporter [Phycisphaerae bacterium]|nr:Na/Pi symporter [Phycisphaerae bacterium]